MARLDLNEHQIRNLRLKSAEVARGAGVWGRSDHSALERLAGEVLELREREANTRHHLEMEDQGGH